MKESKAADGKRNVYIHYTQLQIGVYVCTTVLWASKAKQSKAKRFLSFVSWAGLSWAELN